MIEPDGIRPYRPADRGGVRVMCIRTGDAGSDATGPHPHEDFLPDT